MLGWQPLRKLFSIVIHNRTRLDVVVTWYWQTSPMVTYTLVDYRHKQTVLGLRNWFTKVFQLRRSIDRVRIINAKIPNPQWMSCCMQACMHVVVFATLCYSPNLWVTTTLHRKNSFTGYTILICLFVFIARFNWAYLHPSLKITKVMLSCHSIEGPVTTTFLDFIVIFYFWPITIKQKDRLLLYQEKLACFTDFSSE